MIWDLYSSTASGFPKLLQGSWKRESGCGTILASTHRRRAGSFCRRRRKAGIGGRRWESITVQRTGGSAVMRLALPGICGGGSGRLCLGRNRRSPSYTTGMALRPLRSARRDHQSCPTGQTFKIPGPFRLPREHGRAGVSRCGTPDRPSLRVHRPTAASRQPGQTN